KNALEIAPLQGVSLCSLSRPDLLLRVLPVQVFVLFGLLLLGRLRFAAVSLIVAVLGAAVVGHVDTPFKGSRNQP
ncbi:hypothetical protein, partial [Rhodococcus rhodochrous]|uniref:hypothetical protein n=1 Tax=Rhodococcus rhodochrous TaxID=1829 RepID=UPI001E42AB51